MQRQDRSRAPRRISLPKHSGIYYRIDRAGKRRYEISFYDATGQRRWRTIDGNLEAAQAALEGVRGRVRRGERVEPARLTFAELADRYLAAATGLRPRTREKYEGVLRLHV